MSAGGKIEGMDEAFNMLTRRVREIKDAAQSGFWEAGLLVMRSSQERLKEGIYSKGAKNDDYRLTGNLRASGYVRAASGVERPDESGLISELNLPVPVDDLPQVGVEMGYTANYAIYQHENMEGRAPKFLEYALTQNIDGIIEIIKKRTDGQ